MSQQMKSYYSITPANVRYDEKLSPHAKLLYGEVTALCNEKGFCWATNQYFANLYKVSKRTVIRWINELLDAGYLNRKVLSGENGHKTIQRHLSLPTNANLVTSDKNVTGGSDKNVTGGSDKNVTHINTSINNTNINNTSINNTRVHERIDEVKELYNSICVSLPKATIVTAKRGSAARELLKNYTLEQIREVFERAEKSDFLNGRAGGRKWKANFDWLINSNNAAKVLDGNYGNKQEAAGFADFLAEMERRDSLKKIKVEGGK